MATFLFSSLQVASITPAIWTVLVVIAATLGVIVYVMQRNRRFSAAMQRLGLTRVGNRLPSGFPDLPDLWRVQPRVRDCFSGEYNHFPVTVFQVTVTIGRGEVTQHLMVAVKRANWRPHSTYLGQLSVPIDTTSAPGWILVSLQSTYPDGETVESLFKMLTAG